MTELLLLAAVAFAAGFCTGWSLRAALARAVLHDMVMVVDKAANLDTVTTLGPEEIVELKPYHLLPLPPMPALIPSAPTADELIKLDSLFAGMAEAREYYKDRGNRS